VVTRVAPLRFSADDARRLLAYDRAVFDRFVRRLKRRPFAEVVRNREIGHRTLLGTMVHILNVHEAWQYVGTGRSRELDRLFEDPTRHPEEWAAFDRYAARVWEQVDRAAAGLTDRSLGRRVKAYWMPGRYTLRDALFQVTLEEAHHLGEVIGALWQDDLPSPPMTWIEVTRPPRPGRARRPARRRAAAGRR
jgi:uncharacterized damage-inducible protein DinB